MNPPPDTQHHIRRPVPLTREAFARFGDVIEVHNDAHHYPINDGHTERYHDLAQLDVLAHGGRPILSLFRSQPLPAPITISLLERHPHSSQAFMPLSAHPYLVVVAPPGEVIESDIAVFLAQPGQGVNYHAGTWHHFCLALNATSDFLVMDRGNPVGESLDNCDEHPLQHPFTLDLSDLCS